MIKILMILAGVALLVIGWPVWSALLMGAGALLVLVFTTPVGLLVLSLAAVAIIYKAFAR